MRVMKLPMVDNIDPENGPVLDVRFSWEMREAAKFRESLNHRP